MVSLTRDFTSEWSGCPEGIGDSSVPQGGDTEEWEGSGDSGGATGDGTENLGGRGRGTRARGAFYREVRLARGLVHGEIRGKKEKSIFPAI